MSVCADIHARFKLNYAGFALDVDLNLPSQGVTALFGPSGSGKSTLLRCIAGLERAAGSLTVKGEVWQDEKHFLPTHQRPIGYVFQEANLFPHLSVQANLNYGFKRQPHRHDGFSLDEIVDLLGIAHLLDRKPERLSGGEKQRVAIARALAVNPRLLLMDEPLAALDLARKREILPFLEKLHEALEMPVIYVTHAPNEVARLADHLVVLNQGQLQSAGPLNETFSHVELPQQASDAGSAIIEAQITELQPQWHLALASFEGGELWIRDLSFNVGQKVRFQVMARDVSLALTADHSSSIANVLPAVVDQISDGDHPGIAMVRLKIGRNYILSRLTQRSLHSLGLNVGDSVWAQIKSAAIVE
ncbi:molybdate transport system ATP-binding protein [Amphritea atlantica]|uniref:Molybdate transport system ATP-binding protein n=1 Tax=Amphritea atlantica TaxID=355243 RepID=A0A1H9E916_9GAMM|nr:molybdenum ABC transporter ATP-binding protein [Amphritea atlantica]SEQ22072.1 molybdate transport system ATP-binding protein [Amphritea atlantica]